VFITLAASSGSVICESVSVHFGQTIGRTDILVLFYSSLQNTTEEYALKIAYRRTWSCIAYA